MNNGRKAGTDEGPVPAAGPLLKIWFHQVRGPFLLLAVVLVFLGLSAAGRDSYVHPVWALLIAAGVVLAHIAVNLFNELSDYRTGIDQHTRRTPFSGGSGLMQSGAMKPESVRRAAYLALAGAGLTGLACTWHAGWQVLCFMIPGALAIRFYTSHLARWLLGEAVAGITLGSMVVLGTYYVICGRIGWPVVLLSLPPGILTALLLFLNEFPDLEADKLGGRHHVVIHLGREKSARLYAASLILLYLLIGVSPFISTLPRTVWLGLLTLPMAGAAAVSVFRFHSIPERLIPAMGLNVGIVLLTDLLLGIGLLL